MQAARPLLLILLVSQGGNHVSARAVSSPHLPLLGDQETESDDTRRVLGSSVVTSVSVIMDLGNGNQAVYSDATGRPVPKPNDASNLASPPHLMSPDRYEFYTFNDAGDLVKRLMTLDEIQSLIAGESVEIGSDLPGIEPDEADHYPIEQRPPAFFYLPRPVEQSQEWSPPAVDKVVANVQNLLATIKENVVTINDTSGEPTWAILPITTHDPPIGNIPTEKIPLLTQLYQITTSATRNPDLEKIKIPTNAMESTTEPIKLKPITVIDVATKRPISTYEPLSTFIPVLTEKQPTTVASIIKLPGSTNKPIITHDSEVAISQIMYNLLTSTLAPFTTTEKPAVKYTTSTTTTEKTVKYTTTTTEKPVKYTTTTTEKPVKYTTTTTEKPVKYTTTTTTTTEKPVKYTATTITTTEPSTTIKKTTVTPQVQVTNPVTSSEGITTFVPVKFTTAAKPLLNVEEVVTSPRTPITPMKPTLILTQEHQTSSIPPTKIPTLPEPPRPVSSIVEETTLMNESAEDSQEYSSKPDDILADNLLSIHQISNTLLEQFSSHPQFPLTMTTDGDSLDSSIYTKQPAVVSSILISTNPDDAEKEKLTTLTSSSSTTVFDEKPFAQSTPSKFEEVQSDVNMATVTSKLNTSVETTAIPTISYTATLLPSTYTDRIDNITDSIFNKIPESSTPILLTATDTNKKPDIMMTHSSESDDSISSSTLANFGISSITNSVQSSSNTLDFSSSLHMISESEESDEKTKPDFTTESLTELANNGGTTFVPLIQATQNKNQSSPSYVVSKPNIDYDNSFNPEYDTADYANLANFGDESDEDVTSKSTEIEMTSEYTPIENINSVPKPDRVNDTNYNFVTMNNVHKPAVQSVTSNPNELFNLLSEITGETSSEELERFETTVYPEEPTSQTNVPFVSQIHGIQQNTSIKPSQEIQPEESSEETIQDYSDSMERMTTISQQYSSTHSNFEVYSKSTPSSNDFTTTNVSPTVAMYSEILKPVNDLISDSLLKGSSESSHEQVTTMTHRAPTKSTIAPDVDLNAIAGILDIITGTMPSTLNIQTTLTPESKASTESATEMIELNAGSISGTEKSDVTEGYEKITTLQPNKTKPTSDDAVHEIIYDDMMKITTIDPLVSQTAGYTDYIDMPFADMVENVDTLESINAMKTETHEHGTNHVHVVKKPSAPVEGDDSTETLEQISTTQYSIVPTILTHTSTMKTQIFNNSEEDNKQEPSSTFVPVTIKVSESSPTPTTVLNIPVTKTPTTRPGTFITYPDSYIISVSSTTKQPEKYPSAVTASPLIQIIGTTSKITHRVPVKTSTDSSVTPNKVSPVSSTIKGSASFIKISTLPTDEPIMSSTSSNFELFSSSNNPLKQQRPVDVENTVDNNHSSGVESNLENIPDLEVSWQEPQEVVWTVVSSAPTQAPPPKIQSQLPNKPEKKPVSQLNIVLHSKNNDSKVEEIIVDKILESFMGNEIRTDIPRNITSDKTTSIPPAETEFVPLEESTIRIPTFTVPAKSTSPTPYYFPYQRTTPRRTMASTKAPITDTTSHTKLINDSEATAEEMELVSTSNTEYEKLSTIPVRNDNNHYHHDSFSISVPSYSDNQPIVIIEPAPISNLGLEATTMYLDEDIRRFIDLNNDVAIRMFKHVSSELDKRRSIILSPFGTTSLLAMIFLGARGQTSAQMNDFLPLDDMITFNPHLIMMNITNSIIMSPDIKAAALVRQIYSQQSDKGRLLDFYKARAGAFYDGIVQEVDFNEVSDVVRQRTNELVRTQTSEKVPNFLSNTATLRLRPPLAALSANVFQMDCRLSSFHGKDSEMQFYGELRGRTHTLPSTVWTGQFLIGYDTGLDATAVEIPHSVSPVGALTSTVFIMPGRPEARGNTPLLARLEARLISRRAWSGLLKNLMRSKHIIEVQIPRFEHRSVLNMTIPLRRMGLRDLFAEGRADLRGVNGIQDLYLTDVMQVNAFSACSDPNAEGHVETYPTSRRTGRVGSRVSVGDDEDDEPDWRKVAYRLPLALRPRQARIPVATETSRLRLDRPFLYIVRHNPTGMILHIGRFNPKLLS